MPGGRVGRLSRRAGFGLATEECHCNGSVNSFDIEAFALAPAGPRNGKPGTRVIACMGARLLACCPKTGYPAHVTEGKQTFLDGSRRFQVRRRRRRSRRGRVVGTIVVVVGLAAAGTWFFVGKGYLPLQRQAKPARLHQCRSSRLRTKTRTGRTRVPTLDELAA